MGFPRRVALVGLICAAGCQRSPSDPAAESETPDKDEGAPEPTPTLRDPVKSATASSYEGEYDDEWGENKRPISVTIRNECSSTVMLFFGQEPRPNSNYYTTMQGRSQSNAQMMPGDKVWIVDANQNGLASTQVDMGMSQVVIEDTCTSLWAE